MISWDSATICTVCNYLKEKTDVKTAGINYDYYIERANTIVYKIQSGGKKRKVVVNPKPPRPEKLKVDKLNPSCTAPKGLVRLLNRDNNATYQLIKNG